MITSITIKNFQSHKATTLEFTPGVNVIVGPSDSGKTAIIRALRWVATNRPTGEAFRSYWGGDTEVGVGLPEGHILRVRTDKDNKYVVQGQELNAIGTDVPEEVSRLLNFTEVNLQSQFDRPFLLDSSPGEVAAFLNRVAQLEVIDRARKNLDRWTRQISSDLEHRKVQRRQLAEELKTYSYLPKLEAEVEALEQAEQRLNRLRKSASDLQLTIRSIQNLQAEAKHHAKIASLEQLVDHALTLYEEKKQVLGRVEDLQALITSIDRVRKEKSALSNIISIDPLVDYAVVLYADRKSVGDKYKELKAKVATVVRVQTAIAAIEEKLKEAEAKFHEMMPDVCPLCGQEVRREAN